MNNENENTELIDLVEEEIDQENRTFEEIVKELNQWKTTFPNQTPQQVKKKLEKYASQQLVKKDKLKLNEKITEEIVKAYNAPHYLSQYYLKLMKTFQEWEINGNYEQKVASQWNKNDLEKVIRFLAKN